MTLIEVCLAFELYLSRSNHDLFNTFSGVGSQCIFKVVSGGGGFPAYNWYSFVREY